jgi:hypothetical protein
MTCSFWAALRCAIGAGAIVGCCTPQGLLDRHFDQTFFLATQENGFYVYTDLLRVYPPRVRAMWAVGVIGVVTQRVWCAPLYSATRLNNIT